MRRLRKMTRAGKALGLVGVAAAVGLAASIALASPTVPAPRITARPAAWTAARTARFAFTDSQRGVRFQCSLDGSRFRACQSPVTYRGLASRRHTFRVRAVAGSRTSKATAMTFSVDRTMPYVTVSLPAAGGNYSAQGWSLGCGRVGVCGSATDPSGIQTVLVSVGQRSTGKYWNGKRFGSAAEMYQAAAITRRAGHPARWSLRLPRPADGGYTIHVRATDRAGNTTPRRFPHSTVFTIDTLAPPAPSITAAPANPTTDTAAAFSFGDSERGVAFQCSLDASAYQNCSAPATYQLNVGQHTFSVRAADAAGNLSAAAGYSWRIEAPAPFAISGDAPQALYPGTGAQSIPLTLTNPNPVPIQITAVNAVVGSTGASGCQANWFEISPAGIPSGGITVPAHGSVTLPSAGASPPSIRMLETHTDQDACQGAHVTLSYSGSAHS